MQTDRMIDRRRFVLPIYIVYSLTLHLSVSCIKREKPHRKTHLCVSLFPTCPQYTCYCVQHDSYLHLFCLSLFPYMLLSLFIFIVLHLFRSLVVSLLVAVFLSLYSFLSGLLMCTNQMHQKWSVPHEVGRP